MIPPRVRVVSFGMVLWMLEKAGVPMHIVHNNVLPAIQCAENIALWWLWEHQELRSTDCGLRFPGDTTFPQCLIPVAIWLGTREYAGVWLHGGADGLFDSKETFAILGNSRMSSIHAAMAVFYQGLQTQGVWWPQWYQDNFKHCVIMLVEFFGYTTQSIFPFNSGPGQETN